MISLSYYTNLILLFKAKKFLLIIELFFLHISKFSYLFKSFFPRRAPNPPLEKKTVPVL